MREHRGNLFDLLILLVIGFCILSGIGRFFETRTQANEREQTAIITVRIPETDALLTSCISVGESVYLASGELYGSVEDVTASPARAQVMSEDGFVVGAWEDGSLMDVEAEIRISGALGEIGFLRGGSAAVLVGQYLSLYTERAYLYGVVTKVRVLAVE